MKYLILSALLLIHAGGETAAESGDAPDSPTSMRHSTSIKKLQNKNTHSSTRIPRNTKQRKAYDLLSVSSIQKEREEPSPCDEDPADDIADRECEKDTEVCKESGTLPTPRNSTHQSPLPANPTKSKKPFIIPNVDPSSEKTDEPSRDILSISDEVYTCSSGVIKVCSATSTCYWRTGIAKHLAIYQKGMENSALAFDKNATRFEENAKNIKKDLAQVVATLCDEVRNLHEKMHVKHTKRGQNAKLLEKIPADMT
jgi:hypothetical protein